MAMVLSNKLYSSNSGRCAICGKKHGAVYNFRMSLRAHGLKGAYATVECMRKLNQKEGIDGSGKVLFHGTIDG